MTISELIAKGGHYSPLEVELLTNTVRLILEKKEVGPEEILAARSAPEMPPAAMELYFRKKERGEKISLIMEFLLEFLVRIPEPAENEDLMFNPIAQFRECVKYQVELLSESDVSLAVFDLGNRLAAHNGENVWDFQEKLLKNFRELRRLLEYSDGRAVSACRTCCLVLERLCLLWFGLRQRDLRQIRRNDICIYQLALILQERCRLLQVSQECAV